MLAPGVGAKVINTPVSVADIAPTILDLLGIPETRMEGVSLAPLIVDQRTGERKLFDLRRDPRERNPIAFDESVIAKELDARLTAEFDTRTARVEAPVLKPSEAQLQELRALGYVE